MGKFICVHNFKIKGKWHLPYKLEIELLIST